jgi:non-ribosomal peptide synthetase component E (peptide arylation enzyme)
MLTKIIGNTGLYALSSTTGTFVASRTDGLATLKVRVAASQPAIINFGTAVADNNSDLLIPAGHVEHFTLANTSTVSYVLLSGATTGTISISTVA